MSDHKFLSEVVPVLTTPAVTTPLDEMNLHDQLEAWIALDIVEKEAAKRKAKIRVLLLAAVEAAGVKGEGGHITLDVDGTKVCKQKRTPEIPGLEPLRALCAQYENIKPKDLPFDEVTAVVVNPSKIDSLIDRGLLKKEEIDALREAATTWALDVEKSEQIKTMVKYLLDGEAAIPVVEATTQKAEPAKGSKAKKKVVGNQKTG